ncbi:MAG TPA: DUF433 domain-containing protein [Tepidisphaeraceae bacterium]|jgi:uncharacterized protein (DUF433 family)
MSQESLRYVRQDEHGVMRVSDTDVPLDSVLGSWEQGASPETIRRQFPSLSLEAVYGAIAWSLGHADEVAEYLKRQDAQWQELRERSEGHPLIQRLRAARLAGVPGRP